MSQPDFGKIVIYLGLFIVTIGILINIFGNNLSWFGNLPGDIKIERENFKLFVPLGSMLLLSIIINMIIYIIRYFS